MFFGYIDPHFVPDCRAGEIAVGELVEEGFPNAKCVGRAAGAVQGGMQP